MRIALAAALLAATLGLSVPHALGQGKEKGNEAAPKNPYAPPAPTRPDGAAMKSIAEKTQALRTAVGLLKAKKVPDDVLAEVEIHLKAAEYIVEFAEWYQKDSGKWTLLALERGLERAAQADGGKAPWREQVGRWMLRAYRSKVDGSVQPYALLFPHDYGKDPGKKWRLDIVLHGRDSSLTEAKFIATHDGAKEAPKGPDSVQLEVYGRGNNAYRWSGETDFANAFEAFMEGEIDRLHRFPIDFDKIVLRGFSMGGAGAWHLGLTHPFFFAVVGPGAGFTETHGYIKGLPDPLPDYQEKCLRIYDSVRYAENAFNVPVVAYSGANDPQKAAADNIEKALKGFPLPLRFTHLVAPGLEHRMPPEWQARAEAEYRKYVEPGKQFPERTRYVTYTLRFPDYGWGRLQALEAHYEKAVFDGVWGKDLLTVKTENIRAFSLDRPVASRPRALALMAVIDGQSLQLTDSKFAVGAMYFVKESGKWKRAADDWGTKAFHHPHKGPAFQGPIDDAFMGPFTAVSPSVKGWHAEIDGSTTASFARFGAEWKKFFRGTLPVADAQAALAGGGHVVLFGDPQSNPAIAEVVAKLSIKWTKDELVVNGIGYDPKTHYPVFIQPLPADVQRKYTPYVRNRYVVVNSGHTFHEAELKGTNAQLYPRLGDWAVLKAAPTAKDPAATEVVAAGLFDEFWQFPKR